MALALRFAARSDVGLLRDGNEDSAYAGPRLLVVADGMGGHAAGEVASSVAVATLAALDEDAPGPDLLDRLSGAVSLANTHLRDMVEGDPALSGMGTTLTALLRTGSRFGLVHVGDSRCYLLRDRELHQVTHDHTFVQTLVDEGRLSPDEADHHPQRSLLTNALDGRGSVDADLSVREARTGDRWLLCTDGLSGVVSEQTLAETLARGTPDDAADALLDLALRGGGPDNITCIVADVVDVETSPSDIPLVVGAAGTGPVRYRPEGSGRLSAAQRAAALAGTGRGDEEISGADRDLAHGGLARRDLAHASTTQGDLGHPDLGHGNLGHRNHGRTGSWLRRALVLLLGLGLLGGGSWAAYAWSRQQYYVGANGSSVAIYRGLSQNVLGWSPSTLYDEQDIPLEALTPWSRGRVQENISAADLSDARRIVSRLDDEARACQEQAATPTPEPTARPTPAPGGTAEPTPSGTTPSGTATPVPAPTPGPTPVPTPTASPTPTPPATPSGDRACPGQPA